MIHNRWQQFGTSIFTVMTQAAIKSDAVNLAQGFPDFDGPDIIKEAAIQAIKDGKNQYAPATGIPLLRQRLAERQQSRTGLTWNPETEVTVTSGATEALYCALTGLLAPGDEALTFEPFFDSYPAAVYAANATLKAVPLEAPDWSFDCEKLAKAISPKTKVLLLNTPHNPTGKVFSQAEMEQIATLVLKHNLIVITDEVYEELVFAPGQHVSFAAIPGMKERTLTISSTSKTFSMTGWKVGYVFAVPALTNILRAVHQFTVFCSATPLQYGMVAALELPDSYFQNFRADYLERRDYLCDMLKANGFLCKAPLGSYFVMADYSRVSQLPDTEFALWLTEKVKVACIPSSVFYTDPPAVRSRQHYVRFGFCKNISTLKSAAQRFEANRKLLTVSEPVLLRSH